MAIKILVADDEKRLRNLVSDFLIKEGYEVLTACDGEEAVDSFFSVRDIDLVILDIMMPKMDGYEVCKTIRESSQVPILMLTALGDEQHEVNSFELGANEYIAKPLSYQRFIARVKSLLRGRIEQQDSIIEIDGIKVNRGNKAVYVDEVLAELSPKEYRLMAYMLDNMGRALTRDQILNHVWGYDYFGDIRTVDTHVKSLRAKMQPYGELIRTIRGLGYEMRDKQ